MKIVVVTGCPSGLAHSRMAAAALRKEAAATGHEILGIEEQGGWQNPRRLAPETIAQADVVLIATAIAIPDRHRFAGKRVVEVSVNEAVKYPKKVLAKAVE